MAQRLGMKSWAFSDAVPFSLSSSYLFAIFFFFFFPSFFVFFCSELFHANDSSPSSSCFFFFNSLRSFGLLVQKYPDSPFLTIWLLHYHVPLLLPFFDPLFFLNSTPLIFSLFLCLRPVSSSQKFTARSTFQHFFSRLLRTASLFHPFPPCKLGCICPPVNFRIDFFFFLRLHFAGEPSKF